MASVEKDPSRNRTPYVVRWRDESGKQRKRGFRRKADADRFRAEVEHQLHSGTYVDHNAGRQTFREYAEKWRMAQPHRPNTALNTRSRLEYHVYPALGSRPLATIRNGELQAFVTGLELAPGSVRPLWGTVSAIFRAAVRDRLIGHNPCDGVKLPDLVRGKVVPLTRVQVDALAEAMPERYRALVLMDAGTGLRQGEVFGVYLRDDDGPVVDFMHMTLRVERQLQPRTVGGGVVACRLKNRASYRTVPLGSVVVNLLSRHLEAFPPSEVEIEDETDPSRPVRRKVLALFTDARGKPLFRDTFNANVWRPACDRAAAALCDQAESEGNKERANSLLRQAASVAQATMHDLRHFYASALIRAGLNPKVVAERLGHANAAMTLNVYAHLWPDDEDRSRRAIDEALYPRPNVPKARPKRGSRRRLPRSGA